VKLRHLDDWNESRRRVAGWYDDVLDGVDVPVTAEWADPVHHLFVVRSPARDELREALDAQGIQTGIHYPTPLHLQPALAPLLDHEPGAFPAAERRAREQLSLPMYPELAREQVAQVAAAIAASVPASSAR